MTDFSGVSGRAEFYTYLVFAVVVGPGLAVLAFLAAKPAYSQT